MRAGRGLLERFRTQLAEAAALSFPTIKRMEKMGLSRNSAGNVASVQRALEASDVMFLDDREIEDGGPSVWLLEERG